MSVFPPAIEFNRKQSWNLEVSNDDVNIINKPIFENSKPTLLHNWIGPVIFPVYEIKDYMHSSASKAPLHRSFKFAMVKNCFQTPNIYYQTETFWKRNSMISSVWNLQGKNSSLNWRGLLEFTINLKTKKPWKISLPAWRQATIC